MNRDRLIYLFFLISLVAGSCSADKRVDVSGIALNLHIQRFDQDLDKLNPRDLGTGTNQLKQAYGTFYNDFMERMISVGPVSDTGYFSNLRIVLANPDYRELKSDVARRYPDLNRQETELTDAFKRVLYYFPDRKPPKLIAYFSGFEYQVSIGNDYIGIGLDMFLGADSRFYAGLRGSIPAYMSRTYTPENIAPRVIESYVREDLFPEPKDPATLLDRMIYQGKVMYLMDQLLPDTPDSLKISYSSAQAEWAETNESGTWAYFIENNLLYETDYIKIQKYLNPAPFTPGIGERNESAPKLGVFTGWMIVREYMERHTEVTLPDLLAGRGDAQKILNGSKYRP